MKIKWTNNVFVKVEKYSSLDGDNSFADLCVYTIVVCNKCDGVLRHRVVTPTRKF